MANVGLPDLMAAAQRAGVDPQQVMGAMGGGGGGGGGQMPPQGMPPGGGTDIPGPMPPQGGGGGGGGADMAGQLTNIAQMVMSSPRGMQMVQALAGKLGMGGPQQAQVGPGGPQMPPQGGPPMPPQGGGQMPPGPQGMPGDGQYAMGKYLGSKGAPNMGQSTEQELDTARKSMGAEKEPSPQDIAKIQKSPTDMNLEMFEEKYGPGSAAKYIDDGDGKDNEGSDDKNSDSEYR